MTVKSQLPLNQPSASTGEALRKASEHIGAGRLEEAEQIFRLVLERSPKQVHAWHWLGLVAFQTSRLALAKECFKKAITLNPSGAVFHIHLGVVWRALGELDRAVACHHRAIDLDPSNAAAHGNLGNALRDQGKHEEAIASYRKAIALIPKSAQARVNLAGALLGCKKSDEALRHLRQAIRLDPDCAKAHKESGNALLAEGRYEEAVTAYGRAIELDASDHETHHNLATTLQNLGKFDEAAAVFRQALAANPDFAVSRRQLASVKKFEATDREIVELQRLLKKEDGSDEQRAELHFALAKAYDDVREFDKAFFSLQAANQIVRNSLPYSAERNTQYVNGIIETYSRDFFEERRSFGSYSELPIFIIGMPRSGTSLVEQIIASHPRVGGAGELMKLHEIVTGLPSTLKTQERNPGCARLIDKETASHLSEEYLDHLRGFDRSAIHITDKMPFNFRMLGMIALLFPKARVIHCRRNPLDICVSCYFARFKEVLSFSYNLIDIWRYYCDYERLVGHWKDVLELRMFEVQYEELVANQESMSREMISFCGLEWDDRCLRFYETDRPVLTSSNWQVRQPMFSSSVERWRNYEKFLAPLVATVGFPSSERTGTGRA